MVETEPMNGDDLGRSGSGSGFLVLVRAPIRNLGLDGGRDRDRTCDPYHVKVVLYR